MHCRLLLRRLGSRETEDVSAFRTLSLEKPLQAVYTHQHNIKKSIVQLTAVLVLGKVQLEASMSTKGKFMMCGKVLRYFMYILGLSVNASVNRESRKVTMVTCTALDSPSDSESEIQEEFGGHKTFPDLSKFLECRVSIDINASVNGKLGCL